MKKRRRDKRRKRKGLSCQGDGDVKNLAAPQNTEMDKVKNMETKTDRSQDTTEIETQDKDHQGETSQLQPLNDHSIHTSKSDEAQRHKDTKVVEAQTQTKKWKGRNRVTQTPVVGQSTQETQTEPVDLTGPEKEDCTEETQSCQDGHPAKTQPNRNGDTAKTHPVEDDQKPDIQRMLDSNTATSQKELSDHTPDTQPVQDDRTTQLKQEHGQSDSSQAICDTGGVSKEASTNPPSEENANLRKEQTSRAVDTSGERSGNPTESQIQEGAKPVSYARAVTGERADGESRSKMPASETADQGTKTSQSRGNG